MNPKPAVFCFVDIVTIDTTDGYDYETVTIGAIAIAGEFKFKVKACNDAHITLQPTSSSITR